MEPSLDLGRLESPSLRTAVLRWIHRIESNHDIVRCDVKVTLEAGRFGIGQKARIKAEITTKYDRMAVEQSMRIREESDQYVLIANAFRDLYEQLGREPPTVAMRPAALAAQRG